MKDDELYIVEISAKNWKGHYTYVKWLSANQIFHWHAFYGIYYFKYEEDAIQFKLAWL